MPYETNTRKSLVKGERFIRYVSVSAQNKLTLHHQTDIQNSFSFIMGLLFASEMNYYSFIKILSIQQTKIKKNSKQRMQLNFLFMKKMINV